MNLTRISNLYAFVSILVSFSLVYFIRNVLRSKSDMKRILITPMICGVFSVLFYSGFLFSSSYRFALAFDSLFFVGTDLMASAMMIFATAYTKNSIGKKLIHLVFGTLVIADCISLIVNIWTCHSFDLVLMYTRSGYSYWGAAFTVVHYFHLTLCYAMVAVTFAVLLISALKAPAFYKTKYTTIFTAYIITILINFISYTLNIPLDFSVIFYPLLASFISYYSNYTFPAYLVNKTLSSINESVSDAILYFDYRGKLVYCNPASYNVFNKDEKDFPDYAENFRMLFLEDKSDKMSLQTKDGSIHHYITEYKDFYMQDAMIGSYLKLEDKTDEILQSEHRRRIATHDNLTGLLNRIGFFEAVEKAFNQNIFHKPILLCSNIRDFRLINEIFGEQHGDDVLRNQALMMQKLGHYKNINGRLADDKFAIVMEKDDFNSEIFEESIRNLGAMTEDGNYQMSISIGIYEIFNKDESIQVIYDKAKMAMDSIKDDYQQVFAYYDSTLMDKLLAEKNIVSEFEKALDDMQFSIYLQPVIDSTEKILGAEALVRWKHPRQQAILPGDFIDILEKTGLIYKLDLYVWDLAARKLREWEKLGFTDISISVNVSNKDKFYINVEQEFINLLEKYHFNPAHFCIEIQEKNLIEDIDKSMAFCKHVKEAGFKIFIDRFGSGYSSLNMLKNFEADGLKIDTEFLAEDELSDKNRIILETMIQMAEDLSMKVIAEGVETKAHVKTLLQLKCKIFQGFYYSKPLPVKEFESLYMKH